MRTVRRPPGWDAMQLYQPSQMRLQRLLHRERCSDTAQDLRAGPDVGLCEQNVRAYLRRLDSRWTSAPPTAEVQWTSGAMSGARPLAPGKLRCGATAAFYRTQAVVTVAVAMAMVVVAAVAVVLTVVARVVKGRGAACVPSKGGVGCVGGGNGGGGCCSGGIDGGGKGGKVRVVVRH